LKRTRITIVHQIEKSQHHFVVDNPDKLNISEVNRIKKVMAMAVEMVFVNGRLYK
jgi:hypothetical protein